MLSGAFEAAGDEGESAKKKLQITLQGRKSVRCSVSKTGVYLLSSICVLQKHKTESGRGALHTQAHSSIVHNNPRIESMAVWLSTTWLCAQWNTIQP